MWGARHLAHSVWEQEKTPALPALQAVYATTGHATLRTVVPSEQRQTYWLGFAPTAQPIVCRALPQVLVLSAITLLHSPVGPVLKLAPRTSFPDFEALNFFFVAGLRNIL